MKSLSAIWITLISHLALGALLVLAFEPFDVWWIAPFALAALISLSVRTDVKLRFWAGLAFGYGLYGVGVSWVYVSLSTYGGMPLWMGIIAVLGFAGILALFIGLMSYAVGRLFSGQPKIQLMALPFFWVIFEWMKSWVLTGFPWMDLGYTQTSTWLLGWAPIGGIYMVSLMVAISAASLAWSFEFKSIRALFVLPLLAATSWIVDQVEWSKNHGAEIQVGVVQANVPINSKWLGSTRDPHTGFLAIINSSRDSAFVRCT